MIPGTQRQGPHQSVSALAGELLKSIRGGKGVRVSRQGGKLVIETDKPTRTMGFPQIRHFKVVSVQNDYLTCNTLDMEDDGTEHAGSATVYVAKPKELRGGGGDYAADNIILAARNILGSTGVSVGSELVAYEAIDTVGAGGGGSYTGGNGIDITGTTVKVDLEPSNNPLTFSSAKLFCSYDNQLIGVDGSSLLTRKDLIAMVYVGTGQTVTSGNTNDVEFDTEVHDGGSKFNTTDYSYEIEAGEIALVNLRISPDSKDSVTIKIQGRDAKDGDTEVLFEQAYADLPIATFVKPTNTATTKMVVTATAGAYNATISSGKHVAYWHIHRIH